MGTIDIDGVLGASTLEQKVVLLSGRDAWHTVELPGVASLRCSDGPAGVRGTSWQGPGVGVVPLRHRARGDVRPGAGRGGRPGARP